MNNKLHGSRRVAVLLVGLAMVVAWQGCTTPSGEELEGVLGLSEQYEAIVAEAFAVYDEALEAGSVDAARASLVEFLEADSHVAEAAMASDGYMIRVEFVDGTITAIDTSELESGKVPEESSRLVGEKLSLEAGKWTGKSSLANSAAALAQLARTITAVNKCPDVVTPNSRKVKIVNAAGATNPEGSGHVVSGVYYAFIDQGWGRDDIDVFQRNSNEDKSLLLGDLLDHGGYGVVIYVGHGGSWVSNDGQEHHYIQGILGTKYDDIVDQETWEQWLQWQDEGKLTSGCSRCEDRKLRAEVWLRDDLIEEQLKLDENAMVALLSCNSKNLLDEVADNGAGGVFGWDGVATFGTHKANMDALVKSMAGENPMSDEESLDYIRSQGLAVDEDRGGGTSTLELESSAEGLHLPSWAEISADEESYPEGTATVEVMIDYPDCPEASFTFTMELGEELEVNGLVPGRAVITVSALDADGNLLGRGAQELNFKSGDNSIETETCEGELALAPGEYPEQTKSIVVEMEYAEEGLPELDQMVFTDISPVSLIDLTPGWIRVTAVAIDEDEQAIGTLETDATIGCDLGIVDICFGWVRLEASEYPPETTRIEVEAEGPTVAHTVDLDLDEGNAMFGYAVGDVVSVKAEAYDSTGDSLGTISFSTAIVCGENVLDISIATYDIILDISPDSIEADGKEIATITATLRSWTPTDTTEPTGPAVPDKSVEFVTSLGTLSGTNPVVTGSDGKTSIELTSTESGQATIRAVVYEDDKEAVRTLQIGPSEGYAVLVSPTEMEMDAFAGWPQYVSASITPPLPTGATANYHWSTSVLGQYGVGTVGYFPEVGEALRYTEWDTSYSSVEYDVTPGLWDITLQLPVRTAVSCYATITLSSGEVEETSGGSVDFTISQDGDEVQAEVREYVSTDSEGNVTGKTVEAGFFWPAESSSKWLLSIVERSEESTIYNGKYLYTVIPSMGSFLEEDDEASLLLDSYAYSVSSWDDPDAGAEYFKDRVEDFHDLYDEFKAVVTAFPEE